MVRLTKAAGSGSMEIAPPLFYAIWLGTLPEPEMPWLATPRFPPIAPVLLHQDREVLPPSHRTGYERYSPSFREQLFSEI